MAFDKVCLPWACRHGQVGTVALLLEFGLDANPKREPDSRGFCSPLGLAIQSCDIHIIRLILDHGADVNHGTTGDPPLAMAVDYGDIRAVKLFLERGADPVLGGYGAKLLNSAANRGDLNMLELLLAHGVKLDPQFSALDNALGSNNPETVKLLIERGADPNMDGLLFGGTPLLFVIRQSLYLDSIRNDLEPDPEIARECGMVRVLLSNGADVNLGTGSDPEYACHGAVNERSQPDMLRLLLDHGADPNITRPWPLWTPLHKAMGFDILPQYAELLLSRGADPSPAGWSLEHSTSTPLGQLISNHLLNGRVGHYWADDTGWEKLQLMLWYGGRQVLRRIPDVSLAVLLSLVAANGIYYELLLETLTDFICITGLSPQYLLRLVQQPMFRSIWAVDSIPLGVETLELEVEVIFALCKLMKEPPFPSSLHHGRTPCDGCGYFTRR